MNQSIEKYSGAITATNGFSEQSIETTGSTVEAVLAAREKAMIESRLIIAMKRPRSWDSVRSKLLKAVERPGFADADIKKQKGAAWYKLPGYDNAEGFSIRFAEECMRVMGNLDVQSQIIWEDDQKRIISINVLDLENNVGIPKQVTLDKTMIRKYLKKGEKAIGTRVNSDGKVTYILPADEYEMTKKQNAAESKAIRNAIMRLIPGDIQAECRQKIMEIRHGRAASDPDGTRKEIIDGFSKLNVTPDDLEEYVDADLDKLSPAQLEHLRDLWKAIKEGKTSWQAVMAEVVQEREDEAEKPPKKPTLDTVAAANREKTADVAMEGLRKAVMAEAGKLWGEDEAMPRLAEMCRQHPDGGFSVTACTEEQGKWAFAEISDRIAALEAEKS